MILIVCCFLGRSRSRSAERRSERRPSRERPDSTRRRSRERGGGGNDRGGGGNDRGSGRRTGNFRGENETQGNNGHTPSDTFGINDAY